MQLTIGLRPAVLVTGASGGISLAISQALGAMGWYVGVHICSPRADSKTDGILSTDRHAPKHDVQIKAI